MSFLTAASGLRAGAIPWYSNFTVAKSAAGIGVLNISMATPDAPCVFFLSMPQCNHFSGCGLFAVVPSA